MYQPAFSLLKQTVKDANEIDQLKDVLVEMKRHLHLDLTYVSTYIPDQGTNSPVLTTYEPTWVARYVRCNYFLVDPIVIESRARILPLDWSEIDQTRPTAARFFSAARDHGVGGSGLTVPIRGWFGEQALFSIASTAGIREWKRVSDSILPDLVLFSQYFHTSVMFLSGYAPSSDRRALSKREKECLELVAGGMKAKAVSARLQISESAVRVYLAAARKKLQCSTLSQAVAKATRLSLIHG